MKIAEAIIATTHLDKHNEVITLSGLQSAAKLATQSFVPVMVEHDPRHPPLGRIVSMRVEQLPDGHFALIGTMELFEPGEHIPLSDDPREIRLGETESHEIKIIFDRTYSEETDQTILDALATQIGGIKEELGKKSLEPLSVLTLLVGGFIALNFAEGFLKKAGTDTWDALTAKLKQLMARKRAKKVEHVLQFQFIFQNQGKFFCIEVNMTNPSDRDIDLFCESGLLALDKLIPLLLRDNPRAKKVVLAYSADGLSILYALRKDGVPFVPKTAKEFPRT